jgi:hypothetical protein
MRAGDRALAGHRVRDRNAEAFGEREQRVIAFRDMDAAADQSSGRSAWAMILAARTTSSGSGRVRRACAFSVPSSTQKSDASKSCSPWQTSSGTSSTTGPGRPLVATAKARRSSSGCAWSPRRGSAP